MMAQVFEGKVRRLGNSMAVIIPNEVLLEAGVREGDLIQLAIPIPVSRRKRIWKKFAGIDEGAAPFMREESDRVDSK
jgi:antitoxin component of MazEF toxin-antitoxin module